MVFAVCLSYLHGVVQDEFSQPLDSTNSQLSLEVYPKALVNMPKTINSSLYFSPHYPNPKIKTKKTHKPQLV
jgi:hypothetical protein